MLVRILKSSAMFSAEARKSCVAEPIEQLLATWHVARRAYTDGGQHLLNAGVAWNYIESMHQSPLNHDSVFGRPSCGVNRIFRRFNDGSEAEMGASNFLHRANAGAIAMAQLTGPNVDLRRFLPKGDRSTPEETVRHFERLFNVDLSDAERKIIVDEFLNVSPYFGRGKFQFNPALTDPLERELVNRKIGALFVVFTQIPNFHLK